MKAFLLAATASGTGKTTMICAILQALRQRGLSVTSFKCGPDYIDPLFHGQVLGVPAYNLDLFFMGEKTRDSFLQHAGQSDCAVIEGVMGYYDGVGKTSEASSYALAKALEVPVILVVDGRGMSASVAALVEGFMRYRADSRIAGVLLNRVSPMLYQHLAEILKKELDIPVLGYLPNRLEYAVESRYLGLMLPEEISDIERRLMLLAKEAENSIDLDAILALAEKGQDSLYSTHPVSQNSCCTLAVAYDAAFCFYYADDLALLQRLGCELVFFSPLQDAVLPKADGLWLGGGYPELHAAALSANEAIRKEIGSAIANGMPTLAECGGFLYLHEELLDANQVAWPMVGAIQGRAYPAGKLVRFGYVEMTAEQETILCKKGDTIRGHEFHHWESENPGNAFLAQKPMQDKSWYCFHAEGTLLAGFPHLSFSSNPEFAKSFVKTLKAFREDRT